MNIVLLREENVRDGVATLDERAKKHVETVLRKRPGDSLRVGVRGGAAYVGTLRSLEPVATVELTSPVEGSRPHLGAHLLVALPRPKAVSRLVQTASSFAIDSLTFIDGWKVDKSYFDSPRLLPARLDEDAVLGAEQGGHTQVPNVRTVRGFRRFLEEELPEILANAPERLLFDPEGLADLRSREGTGSGARTRVLAFGPEGGFIWRERESFARAGFREVTLRCPILTTEIAVGAALAQLSLLAAPSATR